MFFMNCARWPAACIGSASPQNRCITNAVGIRNTTSKNVPSCTCTPSRIDSPPASSISPVTATATVGAGTFWLAAYWLIIFRFVRCWMPDMMNIAENSTRPIRNSTTAAPLGATPPLSCSTGIIGSPLRRGRKLESHRKPHSSQRLLNRDVHLSTTVVGLAREPLEIVIPGEAQPAAQPVHGEEQPDLERAQPRALSAARELGPEQHPPPQRHPHPGPEGIRHPRPRPHGPHRLRLELGVRLTPHETHFGAHRTGDIVTHP